MDSVLNNPVFPAWQAHPAPQNIINISSCPWLKITSCEGGWEVVSTLSGRDGSVISKQGSFPWGQQALDKTYSYQELPVSINPTLKGCPGGGHSGLFKSRENRVATWQPKHRGLTRSPAPLWNGFSCYLFLLGGNSNSFLLVFKQKCKKKIPWK